IGDGGDRLNTLAVPMVGPAAGGSELGGLRRQHFFQFWADGGIHDFNGSADQVIEQEVALNLNAMRTAAEEQMAVEAQPGARSSGLPAVVGLHAGAPDEH